MQGVSSRLTLYRYVPPVYSNVTDTLETPGEVTGEVEVTLKMVNWGSELDCAITVKVNASNATIAIAKGITGFSGLPIDIETINEKKPELYKLSSRVVNKYLLGFDVCEVAMFIEIRDLWKYYGDYPALRGVNLVINEGEFHCIVGPSGSGKTTLLSLIGGLDRVSKGYLRVGPYELHRLNEAELDKYRNNYVGFVFQLYYLIPRMNVLENVELPLIARGISEDKRRQMALEALEMVGLRDKAKRRPSELSGGEQQRVAIARAIVTKPKLLLADEPTGNLDTKTASVIMDIFRRLNRELGVTIIMVTHNLELVRNCHRVSRISDGKILMTYEVPGDGGGITKLIQELMGSFTT